MNKKYRERETATCLPEKNITPFNPQSIPFSDYATNLSECKRGRMTSSLGTRRAWTGNLGFRTNLTNAMSLREFRGGKPNTYCSSVFWLQDYTLGLSIYGSLNMKREKNSNLIGTIKALDLLDTKFGCTCNIWLNSYRVLWDVYFVASTCKYVFFTFDAILEAVLLFEASYI